MGIWSKITGADRRAAFDAVLDDVQARFEVDVHPALFGLPAFADPVPYSSRVSRRTALQVPAVKRCRDLVPGVLGTLPFEVIGPDLRRANSELLRQPEKDVPRSITFTRLFEDLYFEGVAWWRVVERGWHGYPTKVRRLDPTTVRIDVEHKVWYSAEGNPQGQSEEWIPDADLIRFDSPNPGLLDAGARAIRSAALLDRAAENYSTGTPPMEYFTPAENVDPFEDDDEVRALLAEWEALRIAGKPGYIPAALAYHLGGWNPEQLQLAEARQHAVLELARVGGVDPEDLGVSTTSRTYSNNQDRRKDKLDFTLGAFRVAVEDRLSMGDVTPRGYIVQQQLSAFLRTDDKTRMETYKLALDVGAIDREEIRQAENKPPLALEAPAPAPAQDPVQASIDNVIRANFDALDHTAPIAFESGIGSAVEVDLEKRTIRGLLVPYGQIGISLGRRWIFSQGSLTWTDPSHVKLWIRHNPDSSIGYAFELDDRPDGLYGAFQVDSSEEGTKALQKAKDRAVDGLSIGLHPKGGTFVERNGVYFCTSWPLMETSLTPAPAYENARVHAVAASATHNNREEGTQPMKMTPAQRARLAELRAMDAATFSADDTTEFDRLVELEKNDPDPASSSTASAADFSAIGEQITAGFSAAIAQLGAPEVVAAGQGAAFQVSEPLPYTFDGLRHEHDFSTDLFRAFKFGDGEAAQRVDEFMKAAPAFAVTVGSLNPNKQRPDLYVDQKDYPTPIWDAINKGGLADATPFVLPKYSSSGTLISDHTTGTEPSDGNFSTGAQTITPKAESGKVKIPREVWDQGGSPQLSVLLWNQINKAWKEAKETYAVSILDAATPTQIVLTAGAVDKALYGELKKKLAMLQFARGGFNMRDWFVQADLFGNLIDAKDDNGRDLVPLIDPANTSASADPFFSKIKVGGLYGTPAWALAAPGQTTPASSYLLSREDVSGWASTPQRITMDQIEVANVYLGVFGYVAAAITDLTGVREVLYDPQA